MEPTMKHLPLFSAILSASLLSVSALASESPELKCKKAYSAALLTRVAVESNVYVDDQLYLAQAKNAVRLCAAYYEAVKDRDVAQLLHSGAKICTNRNSQNSGLAGAGCRMKLFDVFADGDGLMIGAE
jgi:hypothetical protein